MNRFTKSISTMIAALLVSVMVIGQSKGYNQEAQFTQDKLTQDVRPGLVPVNFAQTDFDYTKVVTDDGQKT